MKKLTLSILLILFTGTGLLHAQEEKSGELVNRRVLILDFYNAQNDNSFGYLETSIPDAFENSLADTGSFELLPRETWSNLVRDNVFAKDEAKSESVAVEAGKRVQADVVVMGSFVIAGGKLNIKAKAIEIPGGRIAVSKSRLSKTDGSMFDAINELARTMAAEMKEALPPVPPREIVKSGISYGGMITRTIIAPGWGHLYAKQNRGWIYLTLWAGAGIYTGYAFYDYSQKKDDYRNATDNFDPKYNAYSDSANALTYALYGLSAAYAIPLIDILMTGRNYRTSSLQMASPLSASDGWIFTPDFRGGYRLGYGMRF